MKILNNIFVKRIIIILYVIIMLTFFCLSPIVNAETKTKMKDGEFYYAGTTKGAYVVTEGVFEWLLKKIGDIADFLLGLFTMGGRMVFVGWTALLEELLTFALEATTGVPIDENEINTTQLDGTIKSSNNVTVEAIVYNQVPVLDINLFKDKEVSRCVSGTGQYWVKCPTCAEPDDEEGLCRMDKCTCPDCIAAINEAGVKDINLVTIIKDNVRMWYYVIRLIAMAGMLCVLIFVGIKMAISTVAQEKALYKRMLVDWLVGMILLFSMQYIMIFIINLNETLVNIVKDVETGVTEITKKEFNIDEMTNKELEISVYQAVRTRAYDAKLINGTTGMILYITLVFMAFKYVFIYIKRYFAIIVLTLISPGVAFGYSIQKVLTGKSASFSRWLQEYLVNVIIQTVHAIIYTSFISITLVISLNSISGMILAFVIMNYMSTADKLFRKIFKLTGGGIAQETTKDVNVKESMQSVKSAAHFMTANALLKKSPITKAVTAPIKALGTGAVMGAVKVKSLTDGKRGDKKAKAYLKKSGKLEKTAENAVNFRKRLADINARKELGLNVSSATSAFSAYMGDYDKEEDVIDLEGQDAIEKELVDLERAAYEAVLNGGGEEAEDLYEEIQRERKAFDKETTLSVGQVFGAHISQFLDESNYYNYDYSRSSNPTEKQIEREMGEEYAFKRNSDGTDAETEEQYEKRRKQAIENIKKKPKKKRKTGFVGKMEYDPAKNKWVIRSMSDLISEQLKSDKLLGLSDADKKLLKETTGLFKGTLLGIGSLFVGMGTLVTSPGVGVGLLANGVNSQIEFADKLGLTDPNVRLQPRVSEKNKRYSFRRFNKGAKQTIMQAAVDRAEGEKNRAVVQNVKKNHKKLYRTLKIGGAGLTVAGGIAVAPLVATFGIAGALPLTMGAITYTTGKMGRRYGGYNRYSSNSLMGRISKQHFKQFEARKKEVIKDQIDILAKEEEIEFEDNYAKMLLLMGSIADNAMKKQEEQDELGLQTEAVVETPKGERIIVEEPAVKQERAIIEEAVVEAIVNRSLTQEISMESFINGADVADIKKIIERKLKSQGSSSAIDRIVDLNKKIEQAAASVLRVESSRSEIRVQSNPTEDNDTTSTMFSTEGTSNETHMEGMFGTQDSLAQTEGRSRTTTTSTTSAPVKIKVSKIEQYLVKEAIREAVKTGKVESAEDITPELIAEMVQSKKMRIIEKQTQIMSQQASQSVISSLQTDRTRMTGESQTERRRVFSNPVPETDSSVDYGFNQRGINPNGEFEARNGSDSSANRRNLMMEALGMRLQEGSATAGRTRSRIVNTSDDGSIYANGAIDGSRAANSTLDGSRVANSAIDGSIYANSALDGSRVAGSAMEYGEYISDTQMSDLSREYIQQTISEIKRVNVQAAIARTPKSQSDRREEKKKRIKALEQILMAEATGDFDEGTTTPTEASVTNTGTQDGRTASEKTDAVIEELFRNTAERETIELLRDNIRTMKKLNRKGERMKMSTRDPRYHKEKRKEEKKKAYSKYPDLAAVTGDRQYTNGDGTIDLTVRKETYGPVTDIVDLIQAQSKINFKK